MPHSIVVKSIVQWVNIFFMNQDPADLDGDGEFDAIDVSIIEDGQVSDPPPNRNTGCCLLFIIAGPSFIGLAAFFGKLIS